MNMNKNKTNRYMPFIMAICVVLGIIIGTFFSNHFAGNRLLRFLPNWILTLSISVRRMQLLPPTTSRVRSRAWASSLSSARTPSMCRM